jgi:hypothetical protein
VGAQVQKSEVFRVNFDKVLSFMDSFLYLALIIEGFIKQCCAESCLKIIFQIPNDVFESVFLTN